MSKVVKSFSGGMKFLDKSRGQPITVSKKFAKKIRTGTRGKGGDNKKT